MMEFGNVRANLPYTHGIALACWVWPKWKLIHITVVVDGYRHEDCRMVYTDHCSRSYGSLSSILVHKTVVFMARRSSETWGMAVTVVLFVMPSCSLMWWKCRKLLLLLMRYCF